MTVRAPSSGQPSMWSRPRRAPLQLSVAESCSAEIGGLGPEPDSRRFSVAVNEVTGTGRQQRRLAPAGL